MTSNLYILGDADRVRAKIEKYLLASDFDELSQFSATLTDSVDTIAQKIQNTFSGNTIMAGGDDVLFYVPQNQFLKAELQKFAKQFKDQSGCTISFGISNDIKLAYVNLRYAKSKGGNTIVITESMS